MALIMALGVLPAQVFALDGSSPEVSAPAAQQADQQQDQVAPDLATQAQPANDPNPQAQSTTDSEPPAAQVQPANDPNPQAQSTTDPEPLAAQAQPANDPNPQDQPAPDPAPQAPLAEDAELPDPCGRGRCAVAGRECGFGKKAQGREIATVYKTDI